MAKVSTTKKTVYDIINPIYYALICEKKVKRPYILRKILKDNPDIVEFFISLFDKYDKNKNQMISSLDNMRWCMTKNNNYKIYEIHNPLGFLADVAYSNMRDNDVKTAERLHDLAKDGIFVKSYDVIAEFNDTGGLWDVIPQSSDDTYSTNGDERSTNGDERLQNIWALTEHQREICKLFAGGCNKKDVEEVLGLTEAQLRTQIKQIDKTLTNPPPKELYTTKVKCRVCGKKKPLLEFSKDKYTENGYSTRCKECDRNRKRKQK